MGGNAIKNKGFPVSRLKMEEYNIIKDQVMEYLTGYHDANPDKNSHYAPQIPHSYGEKEDFGDVDILIDIDGLPMGTNKDNVIEDLLERYGVSEQIDPDSDKSNKGFPFTAVHRNGDVASLGIPIQFGKPEKGLFQVDVISSRTHYFEYNVNYFSWNDLGNLMGVIASKTNQLKHGHNGLHAMVREDTNLLGTIELTTNFDEALVFLGYDPVIYHKGFASLEAIYEYASSPKWFDPSFFSDNNRSHAQRIRDRKRSTYSGFLKWCEQKGEDGYFNNKVPLTDNFWMLRVKEFFPHFPAEETQLRKDFQRKVKIRRFFNGAIIIDKMPELQGPDLGKFMEGIKASFTSQKEFEEFVLDHKEDTIPLLLERSKNLPFQEQQTTNKKKGGLKP